MTEEQHFATPQLSPRETDDNNSTISQSDSEDTESDTDDDDIVLYHFNFE